MACCLIGCGSNQGARREQLDRAIELLGVMPGITMRTVSRHRETRPIGGPPDQAPFLNGACLVETELGPHELLGVLAAVENTLHRDRTERWGPRTLDLDILLYDQLVLDDSIVAGAALTIPHPRMSTRRFVLEPAVEIAPDLRHPLSGGSLRELLDNISHPHLHVAVVGVPGVGAAEVASAIADATLARLVHAPRALPWKPSRSGVAATEPWSDALSASAAALETASWPDERSWWLPKTHSPRRPWNASRPTMARRRPGRWHRMSRSCCEPRQKPSPNGSPVTPPVASRPRTSSPSWGARGAIRPPVSCASRSGS